ncbi:hypothetical protein JNUCC1_02056 [Lentibacillus sp. JNUCC-1]|uniref:lysozyme inhibitor LprI family protein n=1 Tax=Lentibacillus sp. JNUCC-1 TaxID=2654513 RepID=UPI0012E8B1D6|nr:lysozyme inhibitor LprI family protein [Lentibacillus sp. JNUCC-1]MUV38220.1 hypothetical protein [Lentibacillus sp. JNUCC-1]
MINKRLILIIIITAACAISAACQNKAEDSGAQDKQTNTAEASSVENTVESAPAHEDNETAEEDANSNKASTDNNVTHESSVNDSSQASQKDVYLKKLDNLKRDMTTMQENEDSSTTYALKKVQGDRYDEWDAMLNEIYSVLKEQLSEKDMEQLKIEQRKWITHRDDAAKEASLKYKGGTQEHLEYVIVLANVTEERCYELVKTYM